MRRSWTKPGSEASRSTCGPGRTRRRSASPRWRPSASTGSSRRARVSRSTWLAHRGRPALCAFDDVVNVEDVRYRTDAEVLQDRHEFRAERVELGLTLEDVDDLEIALVAVADVVELSVRNAFTDL